MYLSIERIEEKVVVAGPVNEVFSLLEDVAHQTLVHIGLHRHPHIIRSRDTVPLDHSSGGVVHQGASDDLGISEGQPGTPDLGLNMFGQRVELRSAAQIIESQPRIHPPHVEVKVSSECETQSVNLGQSEDLNTDEDVERVVVRGAREEFILVVIIQSEQVTVLLITEVRTVSHQVTSLDDH